MLNNACNTEFYEKFFLLSFRNPTGYNELPV